MANKEVTVITRNHLMSAVISGLICLIIYGTMRFYADWFNSSQMTTILGGFLGSWLFLFELTAVSNLEMFAFGDDFAAKFIPEVLICLTFAAIASSVVHRVCMTTCVLFSFLVLYFLDRISNEHYNKAYSRSMQESQYLRRSGGVSSMHSVNAGMSSHHSSNSSSGFSGGRKRK